MSPFPPELASVATWIGTGLLLLFVGGWLKRMLSVPEKEAAERKEFEQAMAEDIAEMKDGVHEMAKSVAVLSEKVAGMSGIKERVDEGLNNHAKRIGDHSDRLVKLETLFEEFRKHGAS